MSAPAALFEFDNSYARELPGWDRVRFLAITEDEFRTLFATSPIRRADRAGFFGVLAPLRFCPRVKSAGEIVN